MRQAGEKLIARVIVPGRPVPAARMTRRGKWVGRQAQRYLAWRELAMLCCLHAAARLRQGVPTGPLRVLLRFAIHGGRRGDWDNLAKALTDAGNGVLWQDDAQIVRAEVEIVDAPTKGAEKAEMIVWELSP